MSELVKVYYFVGDREIKSVFQCRVPSVGDGVRLKGSKIDSTSYLVTKRAWFIDHGVTAITIDMKEL